VVIDDRDTYANRERFPEARDVLAEDFEQACARLSPTESSYIVIVTRGHRDDMRVLRWAVTTPARYIGMIGSRRRVRAAFEAVLAAGLPRERLERVHAPIGLDIGGKAPFEVAVSVIGEITALRYARASGSTSTTSPAAAAGAPSTIALSPWGSRSGGSAPPDDGRSEGNTVGARLNAPRTLRVLAGVTAIVVVFRVLLAVQRARRGKVR
jgi:hypothetical protein